MIACSVPPPSMRELYIEIGPGHWVFYRDVFDAEERMRNAVRKHQREAMAEHGIAALPVGETVDMFYMGDEGHEARA